MLAIPASRGAQKAEGVLFCESKTCNEYHHTLTVWKTEQNMKTYRASAVHLKARKYFSQIASGKVYGYETAYIPSWESALTEFDNKARDVWKFLTTTNLILNLGSFKELTANQ